VAADELGRGDFDVKLTGKVDAAFCFGLASAIGKEDIGTGLSEYCPSNAVQVDLHLHPIFIFTIQHFHRFDGFRNGPSPSDQHSIDIEGKGKGVRSREIC